MTTLALNNVRPYGEDVTNILIDVADGVIDAVGRWIAAVVGTGARQVGRILADGRPGWPWWRVTNARGLLPEALRAQAFEQYEAEGTPTRGEGVDLRRAGWVPPF